MLLMFVVFVTIKNGKILKFLKDDLFAY